METRQEKISRLTAYKHSLRTQYARAKEEVRNKFPYCPPSCEVMKYTKIRYKMNRVDKEIARLQ